MFFEIDDIKRRHSVYYDVYNTDGWVDTPESSIKWDWTRGALAGTFGMCLQKVYSLYHTSYKSLLTKYNRPKDVGQIINFTKTIPKLPNFKSDLKNALIFGIMTGTIDVGSRFMVLRQLTAGLPTAFNTLNVQYWRKPAPIVIGSLLTAWIRAPFEIANKFFLADKKFPRHLRYNFNHVGSALMHLVRNSPFCLFKNMLPTYCGVFVQTSFLFAFFDYLFDFFNMFYYQNGYPKFLIKAPVAGFAATMACVGAYPFHTVMRDMIELNPKEISDGYFKMNYRRALHYMWHVGDMSNGWAGCMRYFHSNFVFCFTTVYLAESFGLFKYWKSPYHTYPYTNSLNTFAA